uniref:C-type lectin domain-containing protein n=1 Tax=Pseudonaja textilis TaxID=8673 RepID=A0A670YQV4_PSETE
VCNRAPRLHFLLSCSFFGVSADTCAREWLQYQGNSYGYFEAKKTWTEAEIECQSYHRGAHLASILTLAETLVVANHIMSYQIKPSNVWIGLHDIRHANFLHLLFSTALKLLAGLCTAPIRNRKDFTKWNNTACYTLNAYVCKYEL